MSKTDMTSVMNDPRRVFIPKNLDYGAIWKDISTAPRDGTRILGYCYVGGITMVYWCTHHKQWLSSPGKYGKTPMQWQPLPAPPVSNRSDNQNA